MLNELPLSATEVFRNAAVWAAIYATAFGSAASFFMMLINQRKGSSRQQEKWRNWL